MVERATVVTSDSQGAEVSARRHVEDALRESEGRYRLLFRNMLDGFAYCRMIFDENGRAVDFVYLDVNEAFERLTGLRSVVGKRVSELFPGIREEHPELLETYGRVARTGRAERFEIEFRPLGMNLDISVYQPQLDHFVAVFDNITERKRVEEALREGNQKLREADRHKDEFLGMLSHELRNPLQPIRTSSYILQHARPGSAQALRAQAVIQRQTEHLTRLVDDLLDVTRIARGKIELRRSRIDLREVVEHAVDDYRTLLRDRGVQFDVSIPEERLWADADATRVTQVVGNLLHNALKFTRTGDRVALSLEAEGGAATIRVHDTGAGIDAKLLPHIFEPFVQGKRTLARTEGGLGLGLALVKGIAELHGGAVHAESSGKGEGSRFTVRLPFVAAGDADATPGPSRDQRDDGRRVLVVDDNTDAADSLADLLRMLGHSVDVAYDGPTAIEAVRVNPPDIVLCDLGLPGMSGYEVAQALRATAAEGMQLIAVSGYAQPEDVQRAIEAGFDGHMAKPCDPEQLGRLLG